MKTANGINIAEKTKTPLQIIIASFVASLGIMKKSSDGTFTPDEIESKEMDLYLIKNLVSLEADLITQAYEEGHRDGKNGEYNSGYFELNFES